MQEKVTEMWLFFLHFYTETRNMIKMFILLGGINQWECINIYLA